MAGAARDTSTVVRGWETLVDRLRAAADRARARRAVAVANRLERRAGHRLTRVARGSHLHGPAARLRASVTASYCYRWLTAEPEPEVVVIDLRETHTVGWFVALLEWLGDRFGNPLRAAASNSLLADLLAGVRARPVRALGIAVLLVTVTNLLLGVTSGSIDGLGLGLGIHAVVLVLAGLAGLRSTASWTDLRTSGPGRWLAALFEPPAPPDRNDGDLAEPQRPDDGQEDATGGAKNCRG